MNSITSPTTHRRVEFSPILATIDEEEEYKPLAISDKEKKDMERYADERKKMIEEDKLRSYSVEARHRMFKNVLP